VDNAARPAAFVAIIETMTPPTPVLQTPFCLWSPIRMTKVCQDQPGAAPRSETGELLTEQNHLFALLALRFAGGLMSWSWATWTSMPIEDDAGARLDGPFSRIPLVTIRQPPAPIGCSKAWRTKWSAQMTEAEQIVQSILERPRLAGKVGPRKLVSAES
jgi:hypothetical protein